MSQVDDIILLLESQHLITAKTLVLNGVSENIKSAAEIIQTFSNDKAQYKTTYLTSGITKSGVYRFHHTAKASLTTTRDDYLTTPVSTVHSISNFESDSIWTQIEAVESDRIRETLLREPKVSNDILTHLSGIFSSSVVFNESGKAVTQHIHIDAEAKKVQSDAARTEFFNKPIIPKKEAVVMKAPSAAVTSFFSKAPIEKKAEINPLKVKSKSDLKPSSSTTTAAITHLKEADTSNESSQSSSSSSGPTHPSNLQSNPLEEGDEVWDDGTGVGNTAVDKTLINKREQPTSPHFKEISEEAEDVMDVDEDDLALTSPSKRSKGSKRKKRTATTTITREPTDLTDDPTTTASLGNEKKENKASSSKSKPPTIQRGAMDDYLDDIAIAAEVEKQLHPDLPVPKKKRQKLVEKVQHAVYCIIRIACICYTSI